MLLPKGGHAGFAFAAATMTVLAVWGLTSPNPTNPGSTQSASTTTHPGFAGTWHSGLEWSSHCCVVSGELSGGKA